MQARARLSFGWRAVKPAVLLLVVGAFSLGLQACGSDSSTSTPVVKKEAGGFVYEGLLLQVNWPYKNAGDLLTSVSMCVINDCHDGNLTSSSGGGVGSQPSQCCETDQVQAVYRFTDRQVVRFIYAVVESGIVIHGAGVRMTVDSPVEGCASLPGPGPNGAPPPPVGDVGTYVLDVPRTLTICGHVFNMSEARPGQSGADRFEATLTMVK